MSGCEGALPLRYLLQLSTICPHGDAYPCDCPYFALAMYSAVPEQRHLKIRPTRLLCGRGHRKNATLRAGQHITQVDLGQLLTHSTGRPGFRALGWWLALLRDGCLRFSRHVVFPELDLRSAFYCNHSARNRALKIRMRTRLHLNPVYSC